MTGDRFCFERIKCSQLKLMSKSNRAATIVKRKEWPSLGVRWQLGEGTLSKS